jgi:hypothetical protein
LMHIDPNCKEYNDINVINLSLSDDIIEIFSGSEYRYQRKAFIFDDINYDSLTKKERIQLNSLLKYISSHCRTDIYYVIHRISDVPLSLRSRFNNIIVFKTQDTISPKTLYNQVGTIIDLGDLIKIIKKHLLRPFDFILFKLNPVNKIFLFNEKHHGSQLIKD